MSDNLSDFLNSDLLEAVADLVGDLLETGDKDGQKAASASLRETARQADARAKTEKPRALTTTDRKTLDKEFWDTM